MAVARQEASALLRDPELKIADVMRTDFRSCNAGTPMTEVVAALRQSRMRILPVTEAQVPIGIVTESAVMTALDLAHQLDQAEISVRLPDLSDSLDALAALRSAAAKSGQDTAPKNGQD